jgi:hypothetical protein
MKAKDWLKTALTGAVVTLVVATGTSHSDVPSQPTTRWCAQIQIPARLS